MRLIDADAIRVKAEYLQNICGIIMIRTEDLVRIINEQPTIPYDMKWNPEGGVFRNMRLTEQMVQDEDKRWAGRNFLAELKFCGREITDRKSITNDNIRFYAWLCRRADEKIEEQRNKISDLMDIIEQQAGR